MNVKVKATAFAIAGTILDKETDPRSVLILLESMRDTMQLASMALAIVASEQDEDEEKFFEEKQNPSDILRMLADSWDEQMTEEDWQEQLQFFRNVEADHKMPDLTKDIPETLHVDDILGEEK